MSGNNEMKRIVFILVCVFLCSGCASVPSAPVRMYGIEHYKDKVAIIKTFERKTIGFMLEKAYNPVITDIDGQEIKHPYYIESDRVKASMSGYEVLPGIHTVKFRVAGYRQVLLYKRKINAKAGHQYSIKTSYTTKYGTTHVIKISIIDTKIQ